ncbi:hypothetical protein [Aminivibrio sp.]|uniref:hypothetical protein n=1 Tax=Aminivibrio sp. TaxID=1872489 RepID=UPI003D99AE9F
MGVFEDAIEGYRRIRLLILDEWLLFPLNTTEARDLLEIVEAEARGIVHHLQLPVHS